MLPYSPHYRLISPIIPMGLVVLVVGEEGVGG